MQELIYDILGSINSANIIVDSKFSNMGVTDSSIIKNLGMIILFAIGIVVAIILMLILRMISKKYKLYNIFDLLL